MKYSDLIKVNENFQYSVNLQFDINDISKINEYIPTKDGCEILKFYFISVLNGKNRATTLIGPYGKGKSHLLLVFMILLSNYDKENKEYVDTFINKVEKIDKELSEMILKVRKNRIKLLPIIINSNYDDINQAFLLGLSDALERENLSDILLNTYFDIALNVIKMWETEYKEVLSDLKKCLIKNNFTLKELKQGLKVYSRKHYEVFKEVYRCISRGQEFKPLINTDIVKTYKDINYELSKMEYTGLFIAFDEFSKFLESSSGNSIMRDLKILQDFAELATRTSKTEQIHLSCITHKAMNEYLKNFDDSNANSFKTVEGRFKSVYFNKSIEQNYEIISYALKKEKNFNSFYEDFYSKNEEIYNEIRNLNIFKNVDNIEKNLFKGCFPLNPITTYSLIELSEKIAQNERTLFTFLTDDDINGLKNFIYNDSKGLFTIDKIYDYFNSLFKKEADESIKSIWIKCENALKKNITENSKKIIKAISIIYMINNLDEFSATDSIIRLGTGLTDSEFNISIDELFDKSILRRKKITEELDFATIYNRKLTKDIKELAENKYLEINEKNVLNEIVGNWYSIPRRYNENYKITRFFTNIFMTEEELMGLTNFNLLFESNYCDGFVINLIKNSKNIIEIKEHFNKINDDRIVLKISKLTFSKMFSNLLREYEAIKYLRQQNFESPDLDDELQMMKEEVVDAIKDAVKEYISEDNIKYCLYLNSEDKKVKHLSSILSKICEIVYDKTPIINNELINKRDLSAPIKKARAIVIDCVLNNDLSAITSTTSAEATIYKSIVKKSENESIKNVLELMKEFIRKSDNKKNNFGDLYKVIENKPYSIRKGIIPILLSMALRDYSDNIIIYYMNREIDLNSDLLVKLNDNPDKYYIFTEKGTLEKINYIENLMSIYNIDNKDNSLRINLHNLVDKMKKWVLELPRLIKEANLYNNILNIKEEYLTIKSELLRPDINNNELLFNVIPELFNNDFNNTLKEIESMKHQFDNYLDSYYIEIVDLTKQILNDSYKGSLVTLLKELYESISKNINKRIIDVKTKKFIEYISNIQTHDDNKVVDKIAKILTNFYIEDWQPTEKTNYINELKKIIESLNKRVEDNLEGQKIVIINGDKTIEKNLSQDNEISALGSTMKNNIEEILEEYGGSLSEQEKISVLLDIMKKYM